MGKQERSKHYLLGSDSLGQHSMYKLADTLHSSFVETK